MRTSNEADLNALRASCLALSRAVPPETPLTWKEKKDRDEDEDSEQEQNSDEDENPDQEHHGGSQSSMERYMRGKAIVQQDVAQIDAGIPEIAASLMRKWNGLNPKATKQEAAKKQAELESVVMQSAWSDLSERARMLWQADAAGRQPE